MTPPDSRLNPIVDAVRRAALDARGSVTVHGQRLTATRYYDTVSIEWTGCGVWLVVTCVLQDGRSMTCRVRATDPHGGGRVLALLRAVEFLPDPADVAWPPARDGVPATRPGEQCGDRHRFDGDDVEFVCTRLADPQPDGRRHRGEHRYDSPTYGARWPNRVPVAS